MKKRNALLNFMVGCGLMIATSVSYAAPYTYVGSWEVDDGPTWSSTAITYTGQEAAALIFGGVASDYVISTVDNTVGNIDFMSWVSTWGGGVGATAGSCLPVAFGSPCGHKLAHNFGVDTGAVGFYDMWGDTSALVADWAYGSMYTNYAFRVAETPEPLSIALLGLGLAGLGLTRRKHSS